MTRRTLPIIGKTLIILACASLPTYVSGQFEIAGTVMDHANGMSLPGAHVRILGTASETATDIDGKFTLPVPGSSAMLETTFIGYQTDTAVVSKGSDRLEIRLQEKTYAFNSLVILGRFRDSRLRTAFTVELITPRDLQGISTMGVIDHVGVLKGVILHVGSMTFPAIVPRGFGKPNNRRFVQLIDGMDNAAPMLNFSVGNIVGISDLDIVSVELVPGAASALYGPNAFNGILMMRSKDPFLWQGLSAEVKGGMSSADNMNGSEPMYQAGVRYAKEIIPDRLAFKVNASYFGATDWRATDYTSGLTTVFDDDGSVPGDPNFDGTNLYGDETPIPIDLRPLGLGILDLRRTGLREEDLLDNHEAKSLKFDGALHYKFKNGTEISYAYRYGLGSSVYQGGDRYALRDFSFHMQKLELRNSHLNLMAYMTRTDDGDSYNLTALGGYANEIFEQTEAAWAPKYAMTYAVCMASKPDPEACHQEARQAADMSIPKPGSPQFEEVVNVVREGLFQRPQPGAGFVDDSKLYHLEGTYLLPLDVRNLDVMIGGNFRRYDLFSDGTVFNEDPIGEGKNRRIQNQEYGFFTQAQVSLAHDRLRITGSVRYDKNENFEGQFSPRLAAAWTIDEDGQHVIRTSYQTGFRNPSNQESFIFFPFPTGILLGGTEKNAGRYGVYNGGAYTRESYLAAKDNGDWGLLERANIPYVQPEKLQVYEIGYKSIINEKWFIDFSVYHNRYRDFLAQQTVFIADGTSHKGQPLPGVHDEMNGEGQATPFRLYLNSVSDITSTGVGIGLDYGVGGNFHLYGHYNYTTYSAKNKEPDFDPAFNMPEHLFLVGMRNDKLAKNIGFDVHYRWQDAFEWESSFGYGVVDAFGTLDGNIRYTFENARTSVKIGGTNLLGKDYRSILGGPTIGRTLFVGITYGLN